MYRLLFGLAVLTTATVSLAQEKSSEILVIKKPDFKIETYAQMQVWGIYSIDRAAQIDSDPGLDQVEQRSNIYLRRGRLGFRGQPYQNLNYVLSLYYDNAGHDALSSTRGGTLPTTSSGERTAATGVPATVGLWDSFLTWRASESDLFNVTAGYFRPQISRESITAAFNVNSFEKAISQNYVRQAVIGRGYGRATGINVGGFQHEEDLGFNYNVGVFNKVTTADQNIGGTTDDLAETQGSENSLVYVGRFAMTFGDPEMKKYGLGYGINYFGKRNGLTVAVNGSVQDETPSYKSTKVIGGDFLYNYKALNVDGEFFWIYRKNNGENDYSRSRTGHLRAGYNFFLDNGTVIEPAVMVSSFYGEEGAQYSGRDTVYDVGVNWYLDQTKYKFYLHYVMQGGDGKNMVYDVTKGYSYGDYIGLGLTLQI